MDTTEQKFELEVHLSPGEAAERIINLSDDLEVKSDKKHGSPFLGYRGHATLQHLVEGESIYLQKPAPRQSSLHGVRIRFESSSVGCRLIASRGLNPLAKAFFRLWFGGLLLLGAYGAIGLSLEVLRGQRQIQGLVFLFAPIGLIIFAWLWILLGRRLARKEILEIREWLEGLYGDVKIESRSTDA